MRRFTTIWALGVGLGSLGCFMFPEQEETPPVPPAVVDDCSDDHDTFWTPSEEPLMYVGFRQGYYDYSNPPVAERADATCNPIGYFAAGGGQGGGVAAFHIEPVLVVPPGNAEYNVTWRILDMEENELSSQAFELFPGDWAYQSEVARAATSRVFIDQDMRGKNLIVEADVQAVGGDTITVSAAIWLRDEY